MQVAHAAEEADHGLAVCADVAHVDIGGLDVAHCGAHMAALHEDPGRTHRPAHDPAGKVMRIRDPVNTNHFKKWVDLPAEFLVLEVLQGHRASEAGNGPYG